MRRDDRPGLDPRAAAGTAYHDSVPMLLISPGMTTAQRRDTGYLHEVKNQSAALANIVAWSWRVESLEEVGRAMTAAFEHFATERPRPVHVDIPLDILDCDERMARWQATAPPAPRRTPPKSRAPSIVYAARAPALLVGGGAVDAAARIASLAERLDAVVVTTCNGKGAVPENHPLTLGAALRLEPARALLCESDVVLAIGTEIGESDLWIERLDSQGTSCASISTTPAAEERALLRSDTRACGNRRPRAPSRAPRRPARCRYARGRAGIGGRSLILGPVKSTARRLRSASPPTRGTARDAIVTGDSAQVSYYGTVHYFPMSRPRQFLYPAGFATLGYGLPRRSARRSRCPTGRSSA